MAILFNQRDETTRVGEDLERGHRAGTSGRISFYQSTDWTQLLADDGFTGIGHAAIEWTQPLTRDLLASRVRSVSYIAR